jgi:hypothetical protein
MSHRPVSDSKFLLRQHTLRPFLFGLMFFFFTVLFSRPVFAQTTSTLVPSSYVITIGASGGQAPASSIDLLDESGTANTWTKYVKFQTTVGCG